MAIAGILKQSTAATIVIGPFVDNTDGKTPETALTITQADVRLSKNAGTFAQANEATSATSMEFGYYSKPLNTTDTNTLGRLTVAVTETGALPVRHDYIVVTADAFNRQFDTAYDSATATAIANAVVEAEIDALETYNRSTNTSATITGPTSGTNTLTITTDSTYQPIKSIT
jgi:hypothetical protein